MIRQLARFRYFVQKFGSFFTMANFITLLLILLTDMGLVLPWYWIIIIYIGLSVTGLLLVFVLEKFGLFHVEFLQLWKMNTAKLFLQQSQLNAINIELASRFTDEELLQKKKEIEGSWR